MSAQFSCCKTVAMMVPLCIASLVLLLTFVIAPWAVVGNSVKITLYFTKYKACASTFTGETCVEGALDEIPGFCSFYKTSGEAALAFGCLAFIANVAAVASIVAIRLVKVSVPAPAVKFATPACLGASALFLLIAWPVTIAMFTAMECNGVVAKDQDDSGMGAAGPFFPVSWGLVLISLAFSLALKDPEASSDDANCANQQELTLPSESAEAGFL